MINAAFAAIRPFGRLPARLLVQITIPPAGRRQNLFEPTLEASCFAGCEFAQQPTESLELGRMLLVTFGTKSNVRKNIL